MEHDEIREGYDPEVNRLRQADAEDNSVANQVADDRQEPAEEGNDDNNERIGHWSPEEGET